MNIFGYTPSLEFVIIFGVFVIALIIQIVYYSIFLKVAFHKNAQYIVEKFPVSIIICAKNEAINLQKNLPLILEQDYSDYEVIVVNDCSEDDSDMIIAELRQKYPHLRSTTINKDKKFTHGKKLALTVGIKAAQHEWLLLTDADCKPNGKNWLYNMQHNFDNNTSVVLGYGGYRRRKGLLDKFIRFDTLFIAMQYLGMAKIGKPYMGVGRNLAYRKSLFFKSKSFSTHTQLMSGDDDLFINEVANKQNTRIEIEKDSLVISEPVGSLRDWFFQKKRHLSTFQYYKRGSKLILGTELMSRLIFYSAFIALLILNQEFYFVISVFVLRMFFQLYVIKSIMIRLKEKYLLLFSLFMDILIPIINFIVIISNNLGARNNKW